MPVIPVTDRCDQHFRGRNFCANRRIRFLSAICVRGAPASPQHLIPAIRLMDWTFHRRTGIVTIHPCPARKLNPRRYEITVWLHEKRPSPRTAPVRPTRIRSTEKSPCALMNSSCNGDARTGATWKTGCKPSASFSQDCRKRPHDGGKSFRKTPRVFLQGLRPPTDSMSVPSKPTAPTRKVVRSSL